LNPVEPNRVTGETGLSDESLVVRAQGGSLAAFEELVVRYQDRVYSLCLRMSRSHADALDLAQTAFLRAFEALPRFQARSSFYTWLFRIAMNAAISRRRRAVAAGEVSLDGQPGGARMACRPGRVSQDDPAARLEDQERSDRLAAALSDLDEEFRAAVLLKDVEDLDYATIAEILDVPVGTVKSRIHRGRLLLRAALMDEALTDEGSARDRVRA
jgi:RNA polymerase sigma-70 factor (ECF subfamily)